MPRLQTTLECASRGAIVGALLVLAGFTTPAAAQQVYKSVDAEGHVTKVTAKGYAAERTGAVASLEGEVERTLSQWRYPPRDDDRSEELQRRHSLR